MANELNLKPGMLCYNTEKKLGKICKNTLFDNDRFPLRFEYDHNCSYAIKESGMAEYDCPDIEAIFSNGHADAPVGTLSDNEKIRHQLWADAVIAFTIAEYGDPPLSANIVLTAYDKRFNNG